MSNKPNNISPFQFAMPSIPSRSEQTSQLAQNPTCVSPGVAAWTHNGHNLE